MRKLPKKFILGAANIPIVNPEIVTGVSLMLLFVFFTARMHFEFGFVTLLVTFHFRTHIRSEPYIGKYR